MRWERVEQGGAGGPGKRWGHTCNAIKGGRFLYVFGGYGQDNCQTNLVHVFDSVKQTWSQPIVKGTAPTPRDSHSCTIVGDNLFVFGGTDGMNPLKDLHILDTSSHTWISPTIRGEGPEAREGHSATLVGKRLFIFGGCGKSSDNNEVYYNDLYILNTETFVWKKAVTTGTPPSARDSHTCSSWKNKMIVIGGEDGHDYYLSDVHILDADTLMWKELKASGQMLPPRAGHSTVAFGKILFVFGGFTEAQNLYDDLYMLDIDAGIWTRVTTNGEGPSARFSMAGDSLDPVRSGVLFFLGGCNKTLEALDDIYYLHTGLVKETERKLEKLSLRKQLKLKCQEQSSTLVPDRFGMGANTYHPMPISVYGHPGASHFSPNPMEPIQQGKVVFEARVTETISCGYTIETVIDGKPLRGIVLSNKPSNFQTPTVHNPTRKRASADMETVTSTYDNSSSMSKGRRTGQQDSVDGKQGEVVGKDPTQTPLEAVNIPTRASALDKVLATQELSADQNKVELGGAAMRDDPTDDAPMKLVDAPRVADQKKDAMMVDDRTDGTDYSPTTDDQNKGGGQIDGSPTKDDTPLKDDEAEVRDNLKTEDEPMGDDVPRKDERTDDAARNDDRSKIDDASMRGDETNDSPMKDQRDDAPLVGVQTDTEPTGGDQKTVNDDDDAPPPMGDQTDTAPTRDDQKTVVDDYDASPMVDQTDNTPMRDNQKTVVDDAPSVGDQTDTAAPTRDDQKTVDDDDTPPIGDQTDIAPTRDGWKTVDTLSMGDQTDTAPTRDDQKTVDDDVAPKEANQLVPQENVSSMVGDSVPFSATQDSLRIEDMAASDDPTV